MTDRTAEPPDLHGAPAASQPSSPPPVPLHAFDIAPDRTSRRADAIALPEPGSPGYRWLHFALQDPGLGPWLATHVPGVPGHALIQAETRPRCDVFDGGLILNLRGVNMNTGQDADDMVSLRIWAVPGLIVSVRGRPVFAVEDMAAMVHSGGAPGSVSGFLVALISGLSARIEAATLELEDHTDMLEDAVLEGAATGAPTLPMARRSVIRFRRYVGPQREALARLALPEMPVLAKADRPMIRELANRTTRAVEELDATRDRLTALQEHIDMQHAMTHGRNGYLLSVVASVFLPLGFLTGLFGVNVAGIPGTTWPWSFAVLSLAMAAIAVAVVFALRALRLL